MPTKKPLADPMNLAEWRQIENVQPNHWVRIEYIDNETNRHFHRWAEIFMVLELQSATTGRRAVRLIGADDAGYKVDFMQYRGFQVQRLTAVQGRRCGLTVPPPEETDREDGEE